MKNKNDAQVKLLEGTLDYLLAEKIPIVKKALSYDGVICDEALLRSQTQDLHPSELAYLIQYLDTPYRESFVCWLKPHFDPEIFLFLADNLREDIINLLPAHEVANVLNILESDDALALLSGFDAQRCHEILSFLSQDKKQFFTQRLEYPEFSAGRLMQSEVFVLPVHWTVGETFHFLQKIRPPRFHDLFIVNGTNQLVGIIDLSQIFQHHHDKRLSDVMSTQVRSIPVGWHQEEVVFTFRLYSIISAPVVDGQNHVLGMITIDDVMEVMERKVADDLMHMGRIHGSDFYESVFKTSFGRLNWLVITALNTLLTALVIDQFEKTLKAKVGLTMLLPIAAAMGGNSGIQSTTVAIRALATRNLSSMNALKTLFKECRVALVNGGIFGFFLGSFATLRFQDGRIGLILGSAVIFNMLWAGAAGTLFPIFIAKLGGDPALSAGPLLTTTTDVLGYALFLGLAYALLGV